MTRKTWLRGLAAALMLTGTLTGCSKESTPVTEDLAGEWRQWRGPNSQGVSSETGLPRRWTTGGANVRWTAPVPGLSNSSPIISRGRVFVTTAWGKRKFKKYDVNEVLNRAIIAYDAETGEVLWEQILFKTGQERRHHLNTPAAVTPLADGERVYVYFGMGLAALDYDGNVLWQKEVDSNYIERARYGVVSSPIVVGDAVIITRDDEWGSDEVHDESWLAAYDKRTGEELWRSVNDETCCSYTTPVVRETPAGPELIFASTPFVAAYDPTTGDRLWQIEHTLRQIVPTTLLSGDLMILPGSVHMRSIAVYRLSGAGKETQYETLWGSSRAAPKIPSPVIVDDSIVFLTDNGILIAYNLATGQRLWQARLGGGDHRSSLVAGDGKIYATSAKCETSVVSYEGKTLAKNQLAGDCEASAAIAGGTLFVRTASQLHAIVRAQKGPKAEGERRRKGKGKAKAKEEA